MMKMKTWMMAAAIAGGICVAIPAGAQTIMAEKMVLSPGGGYTTDGTLQFDGTIAQPVAGTATDGTTMGNFGFWTTTQAVSGVTAESGAGAIVTLSVFPNPVSDNARITIDLASRGDVEVALRDVTGRTVMSIYSNMAEAGTLQIPIHASTLPSGIYYVVVSVPGALMQKPMTVIR